MPAIAITESLSRMAPEVPVTVICGSKPLEAELLEKFGIQPKRLSAVPMRRRLDLKIYGAAQLARSILEATVILQRGAGLVLGMGGYVSAPVLLAAHMLRVPIFLHEQNAIPGRTNLFFGKKARLIFCAFALTKEKFNLAQCRVVGVPVRESILRGARNEGLRYFELSEYNSVLLILGGSQGARFLNQFTLSVLKEIERLLGQINQRLQVLWSTGMSNFEQITQNLQDLRLERIAIRAFPFIERMDLAYAVASFAMSRAGASTIAELASRSVPAILFPLAQAKDNHQFYNAQQFVQAGAAILFEEHSANSRRVAEEIVDLIKRPARLQEMRESAGKFAKPAAADNIAAELISQLRCEK